MYTVAFLLTLTVMFAVSTFLLLYPPDPVLDFLDVSIYFYFLII